MTVKEIYHRVHSCFVCFHYFSCLYVVIFESNKNLFLFSFSNFGRIRKMLIPNATNLISQSQLWKITKNKQLILNGLMITIKDNFCTKLLVNRDSFAFPVVCMPYLDSNIPSKIFFSAFGREIKYNQQERPMILLSFKGTLKSDQLIDKMR